eukprot:scaffold6.g2535.t1
MEVQGRPLDPEVDGRLQVLFDQGVCAPGEIDARVIASLAHLHPTDAVECLDKLEAAARSSEIRNLSAYLAGVVKRVSAAGGPPGGGRGGPGAASASGGPPTALAPAAQRVLDQMCAAGKVRRSDLEGKVLRGLAQEPADVQHLVMNSFAERNLHNIRNMAAFFASHVSKLQQDLREGRVRPPPLNGAPAPAGQGGPYRSGPDVQQLPPQQGAGVMGAPQYQQQQYGGPAGGYAPPQQELAPYGQPAPAQYGAPVQQAPPPAQQAQFGGGYAAPPVGGYAPVLAPPPAAALPAAAPAPAAAPSVPARHFAMEQTEWGVRVDEFHGLSPFAKYVHPAAALKLQQLWDSGNKLVSLLDDVSWEALACLDARNSLGVVNEVSEALRSTPDDIATANRVFQAAAARHPKRPDGPTAAGLGIAPLAVAAAPPAAAPPPMVQPPPAAQLQALAGALGAVAQFQPAPGTGPAPGGPPAPAPVPQYAQQQQGGPPPSYQQQGGPPQSYQQQGGPPSYQPQGGGPQSYQQQGGAPQSFQQQGGALLYQQQQPGPPMQQPQYGMPGPGGPAGLPAAPAAPLFQGQLGTLPPGVQVHLSRILNSSGGLVRADHFDPKIIDMMQRIGEGSALRALDEFASNDYRTIRNVTGYLIGIFKKYQAEAAGRRGGQPGGPGPDRGHHSGPPPRGGGGYYDRGPPPRGDGGGGGGPSRSRWEAAAPSVRLQLHREEAESPENMGVQSCAISTIGAARPLCRRGKACRRPAATASKPARRVTRLQVAAPQQAAAPAGMQVVEVDLGDRTYPIYIGRGLLDQGELLRQHIPGKTALVVTNDRVAPIYLERALAAVTGDGRVKAEAVVLPDGEAHKDLATLQARAGGLGGRGRERGQAREGPCTRAGVGAGSAGRGWARWTGDREDAPPEQATSSPGPRPAARVRASLPQAVWDKALQARLDRNTTLVALGGGVIGDMAGFAAAAYQRGVHFIQVPTTVMAQVDSSVGGKTGVNHPLGKNMIGAFYQPRCVLIDTDTLNTLPDRELASGISEIIKYGLIRDAPLFEWLEANIDALLARDPAAFTYAIQRSCVNKAEVVVADEREGGVRASLNLGHTFGHAIETNAGYGAWLHGEAVSAGTVMAADLSHRLGWIDGELVARIRALLERARLPTAPPEVGRGGARAGGMTPEQFRATMAVDKKVVDGQLRLVLLKGPLGGCVITADFPLAKLDETLAAFCH